MTGEYRFSCYPAGKIMQGSSNCCLILGQHSPGCWNVLPARRGYMYMTNYQECLFLEETAA